MTYGEFETQFLDEESSIYRATHALADGFREFEPRSRPVVWRMLIVQVYFHRALLHSFEETTTVLGPLRNCCQRKSGRSWTGAGEATTLPMKRFVCGLSTLLKHTFVSNFLVFSRVDTYQAVSKMRPPSAEFSPAAAAQGPRAADASVCTL
jgi:hypothetical protein